MPSKPNLLIVNEFHPQTVELLDKRYSTNHLWKFSTSEKADLIHRLGDSCNVLATASWMMDEIVYELKELRLISCFGVGVDAIDFNKTRERNIQVTNTPDVLNDSVADLAIALILATTRNLICAYSFVRSGSWKSGPFEFGHSLASKTLGIAGFGRIGEEIAKRAQAFGLNIAYHNRNRKDVPFDYFPSIPALAKASDILLCMLPGGENTRNMINEEVFHNLGAAGTFINVGRGSSVDETALIEALTQKKIFAAGLDVYADEPNVPQKLVELDNTVLLPHIGSSTVETRKAMGQLVIDNLEAFFANKPLLTEVS